MLFAIQGSLALAQIPAFCPPAGAKVNPPITVVDDLCNAPPANSYRLQEQAAPLSFRQKVAYFAPNKLFSASAIFGAAFFAGIAQLRDNPPEWPQGAQGFGQRFGTRYAQSLTKSTAEFLFGFKEDPRPNPPPQMMVLNNGVWRPNPSLHTHRRANPSFGSRLGHALPDVVWTHYDSGHDHIAFSRVGGAFASGLVGRAWMPDPHNTWGQVGIRTGTAFGGYAAGAVFHEFQPDITKLLSNLTGQSKTPSVSGRNP
jgi:hypothetical protein